MRARPLKGRRDDDAVASLGVRPSFRLLDQRAPDTACAVRFVDDEQRELRDRRFVIDRVANVNRGQTDGAFPRVGDERARVRIPLQANEPLRHRARLRRVAELLAQPRYRLGVLGARVANSRFYRSRVHRSSVPHSPDLNSIGSDACPG